MVLPLARIESYTARDGRRLAVRVWDSSDSPRASVVMLHGITSHGGWYDGSCRHLSDCGFKVHFLDRRGSGLNTEGRGDVDRHQTWIDDVTAYLEQIGDSLPRVLLGISWGGKLAAAVARQHPGLLRGLVLVTPGLYSPFEPNGLQRLVLRLRVPARIEQRRLEIPLQRGTLFADCPHWREYVDTDPLALREVTYRFAQADNRLTRYARRGAACIHTPTLMLLSGRDRVISNAKCRAYLGRIGAEHKTLIEYANAVHTLEFEPDTERYFADLADWIGRTIEQ